MIEMIFVVFVISIMALLSTTSLSSPSKLQFEHLISLIQKAHSKSIIMHEKQSIEIYDDTIYINDEKISLYPLSCNSIYFHFNENGNISKACTIQCDSNDQTYVMKLQLGSGWISIEK